jgi:hypothetical protein
VHSKSYPDVVEEPPTFLLCEKIPVGNAPPFVLPFATIQPTPTNLGIAELKNAKHCTVAFVDTRRLLTTRASPILEL